MARCLIAKKWMYGKFAMRSEQLTVQDTMSDNEKNSVRLKFLTESFMKLQMQEPVIRITVNRARIPCVSQDGNNGKRIPLIKPFQAFSNLFKPLQHHRLKDKKNYQQRPDLRRHPAPSLFAPLLPGDAQRVSGQSRAPCRNAPRRPK